MTNEPKDFSALGKLFYYLGAWNGDDRIRLLHPLGMLAFIIAIPTYAAISMFSHDTLPELLDGFTLKW